MALSRAAAVPIHACQAPPATAQSTAAQNALAAALYGSRPAPPREAFRSFANDVELMLHSLAAALRGSPLKLDSLPDLREDHRALTRSGDSQIELYALVNVETDRITNSLNTLREQLMRWIDLM
jgi:hypothetical protein